MSRPRVMLGRATEDALLYVEGKPGTLRASALVFLASLRREDAADNSLCRVVAAGLVEAHPAPDGVRLWITRAGMGLLHSVDYSAQGIAS